MLKQYTLKYVSQMSTTYSKIIQENICIDRSMDWGAREQVMKQMGQTVDQLEKGRYRISLSFLATLI